ncbi:hypothetical protein D9M69_335580 [compost metagenome]
MPVLAVAAQGDHQDPAWACRKLLEQFGSPRRQFLCLGRKHGHRDDYGHIEMLVSKPAQDEVWPLAEHWLRHQTLPGVGQGDSGDRAQHAAIHP